MSLQKARTGDLRERITIQSKGTPARDEFNAEVITWVDVSTVWAKEVPYRGREILANEMESGERYTRFAIRYRPGVKTSMRIVHFDQRVFDIQSILNVNGRNGELLLNVKEVLQE
jgi:SPP1 family predicted phage head-tail adaptor